MRFGVASSPETLVAAPIETKPEPIEPWTEPDTLEALLDSYILETKMSARVPGVSLYLTQSRKRDGSIHEMQESQKYKLFMVPRLKAKS